MATKEEIAQAIQKKEQEAIKRRQKLKDVREEAKKQDRCLCTFCDFTGMMTALKRDTKDSYAFRCTSCEAAMRYGLSDAFPAWKHDYKEKFEVQWAGQPAYSEETF